MTNTDAEKQSATGGQPVNIPETTPSAIGGLIGGEELIYCVHVSFEYIFNVKAKDFDEALEKIKQLPMGEHIVKNKSSLLQTVSLEKWMEYDRDLDA